MHAIFDDLHRDVSVTRDSRAYPSPVKDADASPPRFTKS